MEPADGNVLKMLVGAVNKMFDDDFHTTDSAQAGNGASPPQQNWRYTSTDVAMLESTFTGSLRFSE